MPLREQCRGCHLYRGIHGQECVGNYFKPGQRFPFTIVRSAYGHPCQLHLRQTGYFGNTAHGESESILGSLQSCERPAPSKIEIQENLIGNDGEVVLRTNLIQSVTLARFCVMPRGVVGMNQDDSTRAWSYRLPQGMKINMPAVIVKQTGNVPASHPEVQPGSRTMDSWDQGIRSSSPGLHSRRKTNE